MAGKDLRWRTMAFHIRILTFRSLSRVNWLHWVSSNLEHWQLSENFSRKSSWLLPETLNLILLLLLLSCFSHVRLCATPWTAAHQAPLSTGFSRQESWSGLPFPSPLDDTGTLQTLQRLLTTLWINLKRSNVAPEGNWPELVSVVPMLSAHVHHRRSAPAILSSCRMPPAPCASTFSW